jgi:hypothetical protein
MRMVRPSVAFVGAVLALGAACDDGSTSAEMNPPPSPREDSGAADDSGWGADAAGSDAAAEAAAPTSDAGNGGGTDTGTATADAGHVGDCTGSIICDDFEPNALGAKPANWQVVVDPPSGGTVSVDGTHTFSGTKAVHVTLAPASTIPHVQINRGFSLPTNDFFGRMMVRIAAYTPTGHHWNLIEGWGYMPGSTTHTIYDMGMYEYGGVCSPTGGLGAAYLGPHTDCCQPADAGVVPTARWACVEWQFDGTKNEMHFWLDGQAVDSLTVTNPQCGGPWIAPVFERVDLGFGGGSPNSASSHEMWIDDVGIDSKRIGCPGVTTSTH